MADTKCDIDQTQRYLQQKMSAEELSAFEHQLKADPQFREDFELNRELLESMRLHYQSRLKDKLQSLDKPSTIGALHRRRWYYQVTGMAAAIILVLVSSYWFFFMRTNPQAIFEQYFTPYYNVLNGSVRSMSGDGGHLAMRLYDESRYAEAIPVFERAIAEDPEAASLIFYQALSYLSIGQADSAIIDLENVMEKADFRLKEPARWYLGLAYLQKGNTEAAKNVFDEIETSGDSYSKRAKEILESLD